MAVSVEHDCLPSKTVLGLQHPADPATTKSCLALLFDGRPMIEADVPGALASAQRSGELPPLTAVYVESIEGAAKRGPTRCDSLTRADILDRFAGEAAAFIAARTNVCSDPAGRVAVGHSLGVIASLYVGAARPGLCRHVVALSAALWWPGGSGQLSGQAAIDLALGGTAMGVWMSAGAAEEKQLLDSNDVFYNRLARAGRDVTRVQRPGGHVLRAADVVAGLASLLRP